MKNMFVAKDITYALFFSTFSYILVQFLWDGSIEVSDSFGLLAFIVPFVVMSLFLRNRKK